MPSHLSRRALSLVVVTTATALVLTGCSADPGNADSGNADSGNADSGNADPGNSSSVNANPGNGDTSKGAGSIPPPSSQSSSSPSSPSSSSTVAVPQDVELTDQGSTLSFGDPATVIFESTRAKGTVIRLRVKSIRKGSLADFKGFILDDTYKQKAAYYYATVQVKNVGKGDVGGVGVPLWGVNAANTLLPAVNFTTRFGACPSMPLPKPFPPGALFETCLVYLAPNRGALRSVSYRPSQKFNPIAWTGDISKPVEPKKKAKPKKKRR